MGRYCYHCGGELTELFKGTRFIHAGCASLRDKRKSIGKNYCTRCGKEMVVSATSSTASRYICKECKEKRNTLRQEASAARKSSQHVDMADEGFVKLKVAGLKKPLVLRKVASTDPGMCVKCVLYDMESECRKYDCTGHYLKAVSTPAWASATDAPENV